LSKESFDLLHSTMLFRQCCCCERGFGLREQLAQSRYMAAKLTETQKVETATSFFEVPRPTPGRHTPSLSFLFRLQYSDGAKTAQYDIHINPVTPQDAGVYTCVDEAGLGAKASATLSVVPPSTSQPSSTTRVSSTTRYTTRLSLSSTHDEGAFCTHDL